MIIKQATNMVACFIFRSIRTTLHHSQFLRYQRTALSPRPRHHSHRRWYAILLCRFRWAVGGSVVAIHRPGLNIAPVLPRGEGRRCDPRRVSHQDAESSSFLFTSINSYSLLPQPISAAASIVWTPFRLSIRFKKWAFPGSVQA